MKEVRNNLRMTKVISQTSRKRRVNFNGGQVRRWLDEGRRPKPKSGPLIGERKVSRIAADKFHELRHAIQTQDYLRSVCEEIVRLERVVFHAMESADWSQAERVGEQILVADLMLRHRGDPQNLRNALLAMERAGKPWMAAVRDLAGYTHAYFTTPLGIVIRGDMFEDEAVFLSPEATQWVRRRPKPPAVTTAST
jgi:hypothetical protein